MGSSVGLDAVEKRKSLASVVNRTPAVQPVASPDTDRVIPASFTRLYYACKSGAQPIQQVV
jgi:hypothetical protein